MTVVPAWIEQHCVVPDGFRRGAPFELYDYQLEFFSQFYLVKGSALWVPDDPIKAPAFVHRRGLLVGPQKLGKGPHEAAHVCLEGAGPALFAGWAGDDDAYVCDDHGCGCGWEYPYEPGEPMGMLWPTPLIQITAYSEEQTDNIYGALRPMIDYGPLTDLIPKTGEEFIRLPGDGRIDTVTSSAQSRLGQRVTFVPQDEVGLWNRRNGMLKVASTQYRGLAGMGGRAALTTNAWDPAEESLAQQEFESKAEDVYRQFRQPPKSLRFKVAEDRRRILEYVYGETTREHGGHIDLDSIEAEAKDLLEKDPAEAERFFGNRLVQGLGAFMPDELWDDNEGGQSHEKRVAGGFDGSRSGDWTAIRLETIDGYRFTPRYGPDRRPTYWDPKEWGGRIPREEVKAAVAEIFATYDVGRFYVDPRHWETQADEWALEHSEDIVVQWPTNQVGRMFDALVRYLEDITDGATNHDGDKVAGIHAMNAKKVAKPGDKYVLTKASEQQKIDVLMADVLAHEAAADMRALGWEDLGGSQVVFFR
ncbi:hypothetical protein V2J56_09135 [Georgenia sp. MJ206]|uniref:hypothetical protein n=1 Tax=Georgenia wangjunii TaxID=3117730 RepID=UPI002F260A29